jgi:putative proteasome-type protease
MSYCLAILTSQGLVMASDSRTNAGLDQANTARKLFEFCVPGERAIALVVSGGLSIAQSVIAILRHEFEAGRGLASASNMYDAARTVGAAVRKVAKLDRDHLERDNIAFNVNFLVGGQIRGEAPQLYLIYPQGNPLQATPDCPYLQIGETKYGKPILDRAVKYDATSLDQAAKLALISLDSTMRSNLTVGPPIDLLAYAPDELDFKRKLRLMADHPQLVQVRTQWEQELRAAAERLPKIAFEQEA